MKGTVLFPALVLLAAIAPPAGHREVEWVSEVGPRFGLRSAVSRLVRGSSHLNPTTISELKPTATEFGTTGYVIDRSGYYRVSRDLFVPAVDFGILILADHITLDLDGHAVTDLSGDSTLIRLIGGGLRLHDGRLEGAEGIVATGGSRLTVERVHLRNAPGRPATRSIAVSGLAEVSIVSSTAEGAESGITLSGWRRCRIEDNRIVARQTGLQALPVDACCPGIALLTAALGEITGNHIQARRALSVGWGTFVEGNTITGGVDLSSILGRLARNHITGHDTDYALTVTGSNNLIEENHIGGGTKAAMQILGEANRVARNAVRTDSVGIEVSGKHNLLEGNRIGGGRPGCGIRFTNDNEHVYRQNRISPAAQVVCGEPNIDGGGNVPGAECEEGFMHGSDAACTDSYRASLALPPDDLPDSFGSKGERNRVAEPSSAETPPRESRPRDAILIADIAPVDTPFGPAALLIDEPGYYLVTEDLTFPAESIGIAVLADEVTLDLDGHILSCDSFCSSMVRIHGGEEVTIRDGVLRGGLTTIDAGDTSVLRIEGMSVNCGGASVCFGLGTGGIGHIEVVNSGISGLLNSASIRASTGRIVGSRIGALEKGLDAFFSEGAEIVGNFFRADDALQLSGNNVVERNLIIGLTQGTALTLYSGRSRVIYNNIVGNGKPSLRILSASEGSTVKGNIFRTGEIVVYSSRSSIVDNVFVDNLFESQSAVAMEIYGEGHR